GSREAVDRLPVVTYREEPRLRMLALQRLDQASPALRDVLKLVDQDMAERAAEAAVLHIARSAQDHVFEIDPGAEALLVFAIDRIEDGEKRAGPGSHLQPPGLLRTIFDLVAAALELAQEGAEH